MGEGLTALQLKRQRISALRLERASWMAHWREIAEYQQPRAGRFVASDRNKGEKRHQSIYDRTPLGAQRTLAAGLMSGMTSPARPWFRLALADKELMEKAAVKTWLHQTGGLLRDIFTKSNTYRALQQGYSELGLFGSWATMVEADFDTVIHHHPLTIGEFAIATDHRGIVDTLAREYEMTAGQMLKQFGRDALSPTVQNLVDRGKFDCWVPVVHLIEPRTDRDQAKRDAKNMPFSSCYFEAGQSNTERYLRESGYRRFPALCPRWETVSGDIYGHSPGMECLGDVKQLQHQQLRKSQAIDYMSNPPLQVPVTLKDNAKARLPGGVSYYDQNSPGGGIRTAFEVNLPLQYLLEDINDVRGRIRSAYYEDMFLMLANDTRSGVTATEVAERHEEKLLMLGPVLERLHNELLSPLIDIAFERAVEANILPEPPPELQDMQLDVEFISTLAQAQRIASAQGIDRLLSTVGTMSQLWPEARHKINALQVVDDYAETYGVNPELVRDDEQAGAAMQAEAQAQQAQQAVESAPAMAGAAKAASEVNPDQLSEVMAMFQGYGAPTEV
jgi:hypothetical protein